jgi:ribosome-binding factor A
MSARTVRINELVQREINAILRQHYQAEAVAVTIAAVKVAPDLRDARVYVSIVGDADAVARKFRWLKRQAGAIREEVARRIVLKFLPKFEYVLDDSADRTARLMHLLDEVERESLPGRGERD